MTVKGSILKQELLRNFWKSTFMSFDTQEKHNAVIEYEQKSCSGSKKKIFFNWGFP